MKDVWAQLRRQEPQGKKCKVGGKSLALFACSLSITCLPSLAEQWKKNKIRSLDNNLSFAFVSRMHVASKTFLGCSCLNYSSRLIPCPGSITKPHFTGKGDVGASVLWQNYCSFHLSVFIIVQFPPTASLSRAWFMTRSPSASSERRCVHHGDFSQASVLFNPKAEEEKKKKGGDGWKGGGGDNWREWSRLTEGGKKSATTYLYIKEVTLPCKFAKAHL